MKSENRMNFKDRNPIDGKQQMGWIVPLVLIVLPSIIFFVSICLGRYEVCPKKVLSILTSGCLFPDMNYRDIEEMVIINVRLPRVLLAMVVGSGLAVAGAAFQGIFGNPLVSPHILGVTSGAGFGAALGILISGSMGVVQLSAIVFGMMAVCLVYMISHLSNGSRLFVLVLSGIIVGALFTALISLVKLAADPDDKLPSIVFWLMGSLAGASYKDLLVGTTLISVGVLILLLLRWRMNILSLSEEEAQSQGINVNGLRLTVIATATLITASAVSLCGIIGWIGLIIPHVARMVVGPDHKKLLPACVPIGGFYLLLIDDVARAATSVEIPLSILTALIGAPFFAYLLKKTGGGWK
ncbi:MAG: iron ABC transporter permease [Desulfobacterium sp.]